jgi:predicted flap endonuclease-1-like 5' DNA nuclease
MSNSSGGISCAIGCWLIGAVFGLIAFVMLMLFGEYTFIQAVFMGAIVFFIAGATLSWLMCRPLPALGDIDANRSGQAPTSGGIETATPAIAAKSTATIKTVADATVLSEPATKRPAPKPDAKKKAAKPVSASGKPELLKKARSGGPDDLKQIKGVGPKLEGLLHSMGVFHLDQIRSWRKKEVEWVDENLEGFKGRVSRDEWVKQAKVLTKGE